MQAHYGKLVVLFAVVGLIATQLHAQSSWLVEQLTDTRKLFNNNADLALDSDGVVHVVYEARQTGSGTDVHYIFKSDGGWSNPVAVGETLLNETAPAIAAANGVAHIVFTRNGNPPELFYWNSSAGFGEPIVLNNFPSGLPVITAASPDIAVESTGIVHIAVLGWRGGPGEIYYTNNNSPDGSFTELELLEPLVDDASQPPSIDVDESGKVGIAWGIDIGPDLGYTAVYTSNASGTFITPVEIPTAGHEIWQNWPKVNVDAGNAYYFYPQFDVNNPPSGPNKGDMFYVKLNEADGDSGLFSHVKFAEKVDHVSGSLAYENGKVHLSYVRNREETGRGNKIIRVPELYYLVLDANSGSNLSPPEKITDGGDLYTSIAADLNGDAHIVYRWSGDIYYATNAVSPPGGGTLHISSVSVVARVKGKNVNGKVTVQIADENGDGVDGATVIGDWSDLTTDHDEFQTGADGSGSAESDKVDKNSSSGHFTFTVGDVSKPGWVYDSGANVEDRGSVPWNIASAKPAVISRNESIPESGKLDVNYPNPFNPATMIRFELPQATQITIKIYNTLGQEIRTLANSQYQAGIHSLRWDGKDNNGNSVASGVYLYQLRAGDFSQIKKMSLLR